MQSNFDRPLLQMAMLFAFDLVFVDEHCLVTNAHASFPWPVARVLQDIFQ